MHDWRLYSSADLVNWKDHGSPMSAKTFAWARGDAWAAASKDYDTLLFGAPKLSFQALIFCQ